MYNLSDIPTKDATLFEAQDFEDVTIDGDVSTAEPTNIEITDEDQKNQYKQIADIFQKIANTEKKNPYKHPSAVEDDEGFENDYQNEIKRDIRANVLRENTIDSKPNN